MRSTPSSLLRLRPVTMGQIPKQSKIVAKASRVAESTSDFTEPRIAEQLLARQHVDAESWPKNLRVEEYIPGKQQFWKVPKEQRTTLKKLLRED
ncbi:unnamed protein product [Sympodiomycopsis kandeliae]